MDIQAMVDARIESLRKQQARAASGHGRAGDYHDLDTSEQIDSEQAGLNELGELTERILMEIAGRVLEITEQVSGDYARLERDILNSRLEILQSAETVLDVALSLRRQAKSIIEGHTHGARHFPRENFAPVPVSGHWTGMDRNPSRLEGRASMIENGVADLFRKTHD